MHIHANGFDQRFGLCWNALDPGNEARIAVIKENAEKFVVGDVGECDHKIPARKTVLIDTKDKGSPGPFRWYPIHETSGGTNERHGGDAIFFSHGGKTSVTNFRKDERTESFGCLASINAGERLPEDATRLASKVTDRGLKEDEFFITESVLELSMNAFLDTLCRSTTS